MLTYLINAVTGKQLRKKKWCDTFVMTVGLNVIWHGSILTIYGFQVTAPLVRRVITAQSRASQSLQESVTWVTSVKCGQITPHPQTESRAGSVMLENTVSMDPLSVYECLILVILSRNNMNRFLHKVLGSIFLKILIIFIKLTIPSGYNSRIQNVVISIFILYPFL